MGIDISQWRASIGGNRFRNHKIDRRVAKWRASEERGAKDLIDSEVIGFSKLTLSFKRSPKKVSI